MNKKLILTLCLFVIVYVGVIVDQTVLRALHPEQTYCQVPTSAFLSLPEELTFASTYDNLILKGWYLSSLQQPAKGTLILAHGYRQNRLPEFPQAIDLVNSALTEGYNFLLFDFRNCGESEKSITTFGLLESYDLISAVDLAHNLNPDLPIYVLGISMGAAAAVLAAEQSPLIKALIIDSSFADLKSYLSRHLPT